MIGILLAWPERIHDQTIRVEEFYGAAQRNAYEAICSLIFDRGAPVDLVTLADELKRLGKTTPTPAELCDWTERIPTGENLTWHCRRLRGLATQRRLLKALGEQRDRIAQCDAAEVDGVALELQRQIADSCDADSRLTTAQELATEVRERLYADPNTAPTRLATGIKTLDDITGGLPFGHPTMIGARTSMGKSCLSRCILDNVTATGTPAGLVSLEDSPVDTMQWLGLRHSGVGIERIVHRLINAGEIDRIERELAKLAKRPMLFCHQGTLTPMEVCQRLRQMHSRTGIRLGIVDFINRARLPGKRSRNEELADFVSMLCDVAHDCSMALVVVAQLNRECEKEDRLPELTDFRDCGGIEDSAEVAILVHRPWRIKQDATKPRTAKLLKAIVAKLKQGELATADLYFEGSLGWIKDPPSPDYFDKDNLSRGQMQCSRPGCQRLALEDRDYCGRHLTAESDSGRRMPYVD